MKKSLFAAALLASFAVVACGPKQEVTDETEATAAEATEEVQNNIPVPVEELDHTITKAQLDEVSYLLGVNLGGFIKGYGFGDKFNYNALVKGVKDMIGSKGERMDPDFASQFKYDPNDMDQVFTKYLENIHFTKADKNLKEGDKYLAANKKKAGVEVTESGLQYRIIEAGNDVKANPTDTVTVKYCGKHIDGTVFDQTPEDSEGISFPLNGVIPGWTEGMALVGEGGQIELTIPAELAYGANGAPGAIEPNETLVFDVTLIKVSKAADAE